MTFAYILLGTHTTLETPTHSTICSRSQLLVATWETASPLWVCITRPGISQDMQWSLIRHLMDQESILFSAKSKQTLLRFTSKVVLEIEHFSCFTSAPIRSPPCYSALTQSERACRNLQFSGWFPSECTNPHSISCFYFFNDCCASWIIGWCEFQGPIFQNSSRKGSGHRLKSSLLPGSYVSRIRWIWSPNKTCVSSFQKIGELAYWLRAILFWESCVLLCCFSECLTNLCTNSLLVLRKSQRCLWDNTFRCLQETIIVDCVVKSQRIPNLKDIICEWTPNNVLQADTNLTLISFDLHWLHGQAGARAFQSIPPSGLDLEQFPRGCKMTPPLLTRRTFTAWMRSVRFVFDTYSLG